MSLQQAVNSENRLLARFLYDQLIFNFTPYWTTAVLAAGLVCLFFLLVGYLGLVYGALYWSLAYVLVSWVLLQWQVVDHRGRIDLGCLVGVFVCLAGSHYVFVWDFMSLFTQLLSLAAATALVYFAAAFHSKKPLYSKVAGRHAVSEQIILSSPSEGPDAEADLRALDNPDSASAKPANPQSPKRSVFVKDQFTGVLKRVAVEDLAETTSPGKKAVRKRTLGPRLCGTCLTDKRGVGPATSSASGGASSAGTVISMATHCSCCGVCVVDQDHHSNFMG